MGANPEMACTAMPRCPAAWHDKNRWENALQRAARPFRILGDTLWPLVIKPEDGQMRPGGHCAEQWVADAVASILFLMTAVVRDAWVQVHNAPAIPCVPLDRELDTIIGSEEALANALKSAHLRGEMPAAILNRCFGWMKNAGPTQVVVCATIMAYSA